MLKLPTWPAGMVRVEFSTPGVAPTASGIPAGTDGIPTGAGVAVSDQASRVFSGPELVAAVASSTSSVQVPCSVSPWKADSACAGRKVAVYGAAPCNSVVGTASEKVV